MVFYIKDIYVMVCKEWDIYKYFIYVVIKLIILIKCVFD